MKLYSVIALLKNVDGSYDVLRKEVLSHSGNASAADMLTDISADYSGAEVVAVKAHRISNEMIRCAYACLTDDDDSSGDAVELPKAFSDFIEGL